MSDSSDAIVQKLAIVMKSWKSIELRSREEITQHVPLAFAGGRAPYNQINTHYIETSQGKRMLDLGSRAPDGRGRREIGYCDGSRCATVDFTGADLKTQGEVRIGRSFMSEGKSGSTQRPHCLKYLYVGKTPIHEALPHAVGLGSDRVIGRDADRYLFPKVRWAMKEQDLVYSLDHETAIPLKIESFTSEENRQANFPDWTWSVTRFELVQGHPVALESEHQTWTVTRTNSEPKLYRTSKETIESVNFDRDYTPSTFWPEILAEARVIDSIAGKVKQPAQPASPPSEVKAGTTIQVAPEASWTPAISSAALGVGIVILIASVILSWRRT